ncbi:toxin-antitoxin system TumE family protein [Halomarina pelagica]|uniref:toxin-antitoxin system TumE family protein n=1 Tax=Halomarina pelagica TaxID=2961599 RepID=UPI0020C2DC4D|nr:DUF6516 family protein [Halomarina sp. BND7]
MAEDGAATLLIKRREDFGETFADVRVWSVPASTRYPDGVKYGMQYGYRDAEAAEVANDDGTVIRYDNFPDHPGAPHHHKHQPDGTVDPVEFTGVRPLYRRFKREVTDDYDEPWD